MSKFAASSRFTFIFLICCGLVIVTALAISYTWVLEQKTTHWAVEGPGVLGAFFHTILLGIGGYAITGLALTERVFNLDSWKKTTLAIAMAAGLSNLANSFIFLGERGWLILYRDIFAISIFSALIAVIAASLCFYLNRTGAGALRIILISTGATTLLVPISMLGQLLMHCTSGDCL